ncbi:MAG: S46 family peptidase [Ignavibacteria bacterium]|nr:S46 family peptidase [Ignavibacteria bacterium]
MKTNLRNRPLYFFYSILLLTMVFVFSGSTPPEEGMYPLSEISKLDLKKAGLKIDINEIYNPKGSGLIDALVNIGGCTGSFVSEEGLIITNHHCVFDYVSRASSVENNYLENGFLAENKSQEIPAQGSTCKITESYDDVSDIILQAANKAADVAERTKAIQKKSKELIEEAEKNDPAIKAEVSEMFIGKTYILFKYRIIKDVRLVYAPPKSIGEFGGEGDNWVWPRHTGDFSFVRAYVAPDGSSANYSKENVPFKPKKFLKVNPNGVEENDFVFILGYPGRTFRHQPSQFIQYQEKFLLPYTAELYTWIMNEFKKLGENDPKMELKLSSRIKSLANTQKNYLGKIKGLRRLSLVESKQNEESELKQLVLSNKNLTEKYSSVFEEISSVYNEIFELGRFQILYPQLLNNNMIMRIGNSLIDYVEEMAKPENDRKTQFTEKNLPAFENRVNQTFSDLFPEVEQLTLTKILSDAVKYPEMEIFPPFAKLPSEKGEIEKFVNNIISKTELKSINDFNRLKTKSIDELEKMNDPLLSFLFELRNEFKPFTKKNDERSGKLNILLAKYLEVKKEWQEKTFVPDANSTLRLTYGNVKGYSPVDATYYKPITTLAGVIEKSYMGGEYVIPSKLKELYDKKDFGRFKNKKLNDVPVAILYNTDTSGGNSGSPIMNAKGEIIGVNFDRAFDATINDFAWSEAYSRSIGVDIRYVLWVTQKIGGADYLLKEMGVALK